ncbi:MAG TPA: hypothetical protein VG963_01695, partial [Polyangiaceae bacterium]|nr:hypothetical protein [Polyangiaceae bacterium]
MMDSRFDDLRIALEIAWRNLIANRWKTLIVGSIVAFGALLVVLGTSLTDGIDRAIRGSITGSYAGHIQIYSKESRDQLEVMGRFSAGLQDLAPLLDFEAVKRVTGAVPNVKAVVPMGVSNALVGSGSTLDGALERLRKLARGRSESGPSPELLKAYEAQKNHVRRVLGVLGRDFEKAAQIADARTSAQDLEVMRRALRPEFWESFDRDPYDHLEFLENAVIPLASDADILFVNYLGTDPKEFARSFARMKIVDGAPIPEGERGFLFSKYVYEDQVKLKAVRGLDKLKRARDEGGARIADDPDLQRIVRESAAGVQEIVLQLDDPKAVLFRAKLRRLLKSDE